MSGTYQLSFKVTTTNREAECTVVVLREWITILIGGYFILFDKIIFSDYLAGFKSLMLLPVKTGIKHTDPDVLPLPAHLIDLRHTRDVVLYE